jgi:uncharacterized protein
MRIIRKADCKVMPWKNGGGTTMEIMCVPPDAENFDWRISVADVVEAGPFSRFPGYERHTVVIEGEGMDLISQNGSKTRLNHMIPIIFSGDDDVRGELPFGPVKDFNLIVRRGYGAVKLAAGRFATRFLDTDRLVHVVSGSAAMDGKNLQAGDSIHFKLGEDASLTGSVVVLSCAISTSASRLPFPS